jgi:hypothetical protein
MERKWNSALLEGRSAAFLALLLTLIPTLSNLNLSASHALQYPMLFIPIDYTARIKLDRHGDKLDLNRLDPLDQMIVSESYLRGIFQKMSSNLETLAAPVGFYDLGRAPLWKLQPSFRLFHSLKHLTITQSHLSSDFWTDILPRSLRHLTIVDARR